MATQATINRHARGLLERDFKVIQYAGKRVVRLPGGRVFSVSEDLFNGCFDAVAMRASGTRAPMLFVQWTSSNRGSVSYRRRKIERGFIELWSGTGASTLRWLRESVRVELWAWVPRTGFKVLRWDWKRETWSDEGIMPRAA